MGLFSKSTNTGPLPTINVSLNTPQDHVFKPNDTVTGHITLSTPIPLNPQAIEASLWGNSNVWMRDDFNNSSSETTKHDYYHYRDNVPLFNIVFNVLTEKHLQPGLTYTFPFQFRVPQGTNANRAGGYKDNNDSRWTIQPHLLPPTFQWGQRTDDPDHAKITYGVTGRLVCPGVGGGKKGDKPIEASAPIIFQPLNPHLNQPFSVVPYSKTFTLASSALAGQDPSSIGFRKKLSDRFSSKTPKLDFEFGVEVPDFLASGTEFMFRSTFNVISKSDNVVGLPAITFKVLKLELIAFTYIRASRDMQSDFYIQGQHYDDTPTTHPTGAYSGIESTLQPEKKMGLNAQPDHRVAQLEEVVAMGDKKGTEQAQSCEAWFSARVPGTTPPAFQSFAITRKYSVKVKMGVEVGGKKFEYEVESVPQHHPNSPLSLNPLLSARIHRERLHRPTSPTMAPTEINPTAEPLRVASPPPTTRPLHTLPPPFTNSNLTLLTQGAEALVYKTTFLTPTTPCVVKYRPPKPYRHPTLDKRLTKARLLAEARVLVRCKKEGVAVPGVLGADWESGWLVLGWVEGRTVRKVLDGWAERVKGRKEGDAEDEDILDLMRRVGRCVGRLHDIGVCHGDLTTSNLMLRTPDQPSSGSSDPSPLAGEITLIDFGLATSSTSAQDEDRAVDLYVLERAFAATHPAAEPLFQEVLKAYGESFKGAKGVLRRLEDVRLRGRKRSMLG
ncbi:kinase-like protein [Lentithecium fluviatile CBS 122367]|uniref:EKC/KEOPS complex subunit BUD32 n=1 Tax=Lentithecium fluviatile CBS 122367 TaxID=1168545 RepID=A0A6G1J952_9PLEO|nr:kinase-like protein [Lentithecium fluviatile CBS 122367]